LMASLPIKVSKLALSELQHKEPSQWTRSHYLS
jgi:hypothetical protein